MNVAYMCTTQNAPDDISGHSHRHKKWPELLGRVNRNELGRTDWQINGPAAELAQDPPGTGNEIQSEWIYKVLLDAHLRVYCWIVSELKSIDVLLFNGTSPTPVHQCDCRSQNGDKFKHWSWTRANRQHRFCYYAHRFCRKSCCAIVLRRTQRPNL